MASRALLRASSAVLYATPFLVVPLVTIRALRIPLVHSVIGALAFALIAGAALALGAGAARSPDPLRRGLASAGALFVSPFAAMALLWVGLGTPWDSTPAENQLRYAVLLFASVAVTAAFVIVRDVLRDPIAPVLRASAFTAALLAGAAYVLWTSLQLGLYSKLSRAGNLSPALIEISEVLDAVLFAACLLTYGATALLSVFLVSAQRLGRVGGAILFTLNTAAIALLVIRGVAFPDPATAPFYTRPGFVAGIPAVPWIMPCVLGAALLSRASREHA